MTAPPGATGLSLVTDAMSVPLAINGLLLIEVPSCSGFPVMGAVTRSKTAMVSLLPLSVTPAKIGWFGTLARNRVGPVISAVVSPVVNARRLSRETNPEVRIKGFVTDEFHDAV